MFLLLAFLVPAKIPQGYKGPRSVRHTLMKRKGGEIVRYTKRVRSNESGKTRGSMVSRGLSTAAPYVAAALGPYGRAAYTGYQLARGAYSVGKALMRGGKRTSAPRRSYHTLGGYGGKFKKATRKGKKSQMDIYASKGFIYTDEISGTVSDPDCVYITCKALSSYDVIRHAVQALLRKLFTKAGQTFVSPDQEISNTAFNVAAGYKVELEQQQLDTGVYTINASYTTVDGDTLSSVANAFYNSFLQYSAGYTTVPGAGNASNAIELIRMTLYNSDFNTTQGFQFVCNLDLRNERIHVIGKADIKVQNRTKSASSSSDAEDVSNNPLQGRMYMFNGLPRLKNGAGYLLQDIRVDSGVQLVRAAQLTNTGFKEPPSPNNFWNCTKSSAVRLAPGEIKKAVVYEKMNRPFLLWLKNMRVQYSTSTGFYESQLGNRKCCMMAFEDMINVNLSENISIAYECNRQSGIYFTTVKNTSATWAVTNTSLSNNPT